MDDSVNMNPHNRSRQHTGQVQYTPNHNQLTYNGMGGMNDHGGMEGMDQSIQLDTIENYHYGQSNTSKGYTTKYFKELNRKFLEED